MKIERCVLPNFVKLGIKEKIGHINETTRNLNEAIKHEELEIKNKRTIWVDKDKQTSSAYDIKGKENSLSTSEKK